MNGHNSSGSHHSNGSINSRGADLQLPTLDLHGYTKIQAIRKLTDFLEAHSLSSQPQWVVVIAGSGAHSQHGPVLKTAVIQLLEKRNVIYKLQTSGSLLVLATSGETLYPSLEGLVDTKVVIADAADEGVTMQRLYRKRQPFQHQYRSISSSSNNASFGQSSQHSTTASATAAAAALMPADFEYTVAQVHQQQSELERARGDSLEHYNSNERNSNKEEQKQLEAVINMSRKQIEFEQQQEDELLRHALHVSIQEKPRHLDPTEEERLLQLAIAQSEREQQEQEQFRAEREAQLQLQEERLLQQVIEELKKQERLRVERERQLQMQEERVLQQVMVASSKDDEVEALEEALRRSLNELSMEERILAEVLALSLRDT
jgi:hypothetical protein